VGGQIWTAGNVLIGAALDYIEPSLTTAAPQMERLQLACVVYQYEFNGNWIDFALYMRLPMLQAAVNLMPVIEQKMNVNLLNKPVMFNEKSDLMTTGSRL